MSQIRKLDSISPVQIWWQRIQGNVKLYAKMVNRSPNTSDEAFDFWMQQIKQMYGEIQRSACPDEADDVYTHLTRSMVNLTMCYEAQRMEDWAKVDIFYGRALEEWETARLALAQNSILIWPS